MTETPDWRARRWAATHQRIYDTAIDLFQEHGFDAVSVGQIARSAEVSVPTFYAHYASKEHIVMQLATQDEIAALVAALPAELPLRERLRGASPLFFSTWTGEYGEAQLVRWRIIADNPSLRTRAAEFERATAEMITKALRAEREDAVPPGDTIVVYAYMAAFTAGVLAWADCNGKRAIEELVDESFAALH